MARASRSTGSARSAAQANGRSPASSQSPLDRGRVLQPLDVGVRAINGLLTIGQGQRVGIMAGSGVGKSVLLGMMVRAAQAEVVVIGLIGERSAAKSPIFSRPRCSARRVRARLSSAVPANHSPVLRIRGALACHCHCRGVPRGGQEGAADHGFAHSRRACRP
jgi:flagellum-specific ATP synthase